MWRHTPVTHKSHAKGYSVFDAKNQVILLCSVKETGSRTQHSIGILLTKEINTALQVIKVNINWESWWIGGCSCSLINNTECLAWSKENMNVLMDNGQVLKNRGIGTIQLKINDRNPVSLTPNCEQ